MTRTKTHIPEKLAVHVDDALLDANVDNYPHMDHELSAGETEAVARIRQKLGSLSLFHATKNHSHNFHATGILPSSHLPRLHRDNQSTLDRSLGLDEYTFMHWAPDRRSIYGDRLLRINTAAVLMAPNTLVSPSDIPTQLAPFYFSRRKTFGELKTARKHRLDRYFSSLVRGDDWMEITARDALFSAIHHENPLQRFDAPGQLGEIKHLGPITPDMITGEITTPAAESHELTRMAKQGFIFPRTPNTSSAMDTINEWRDIIDIARS